MSGVIHSTRESADKAIMLHLEAMVTAIAALRDTNPTLARSFELHLTSLVVELKDSTDGLGDPEAWEYFRALDVLKDRRP